MYHVAGALFFNIEVMSDSWIEAWLGEERLQRYVDACAGDRQRALELYEWNVATSQILMHDIAHFEVALRNAYDAAISAHWPHSTHWLLHPESPAVMPIWRTRNIGGLKRGADVNFITRKNVDEAIKRSGYKRATPGKVIAELSFGFWRQLTTKAMEKGMWVPYLHKAFPKGTVRSVVDGQIKLINDLRNRIAHHEPLFTQTLNPVEAHAALMNCLNLIAPRVYEYVDSRSRARESLEAKP